MLLLTVCSTVLAVVAAASGVRPPVVAPGPGVNHPSIDVVLGAASPMSPSWFGYNPGDHAAITGPWTDPSFNTAVAALKPGNIRYPSGTAANYWDWPNGCEGLGSMGPCKTVGVSTLEKFAVTLRAANASTLEWVYVDNVRGAVLDAVTLRKTSADGRPAFPPRA